MHPPASAGSLFELLDQRHAVLLEPLADEVGIEHVGVSPSDTGSSLGSLVRETVAVSLGRFVDYRRLDNWL